MAEPKTLPTDEDVRTFLDQVEPESRREQACQLLELMSEVSGYPPRMWGSSLIGFGQYHYRYESGREGDFFLTGFSPRKRNFSIYVMAGLEHFPELLERLGKHKTGSSCLYVNKLADIDLEVLRELIAASIEAVKARYPSQ